LNGNTNEARIKFTSSSQILLLYLAVKHTVYVIKIKQVPSRPVTVNVIPENRGC